MRERELVQQRVPGLSVEWKVIPKTEAIHEALLTGGLDVAIGTATTFLQFRASGVPVRALAAVSELPTGIVTNRPAARSLRDLGPADRIAVPDAGDHLATIFRLAALREFGDARALDGLLVSMPIVDGFAALRARRDVSAQALIAPYLEVAQDTTGLRRLDDPAAMPRVTTLVAYMLPEFRERRRLLYDAFVDALAEAGPLVTAAPETTMKLLNERDDLDLSSLTLAAYLSRPGVVYGGDLRGLGDLARLLSLADLIRSPLPAPGELTFEPSAGA